MKKYRFLSLFLSLLLLCQCCVVPVSASNSTGETTESSETEPTVPTVAYGNATVSNGCRTIDGQSPLGGSERMLETAQAAFIYETTTQTVIYAYSPDIRLAPGSLSKIMTAMIAIEKGNLDDVITVSTREISQLPVGAITAKLKEGEQVTLRDVLYCLILASANDAALIVAEYIAGDEAKFVELMNQRAAELGCTNTYFTNCHGLDNAQQYTTARDIAKITLAATQSETFCEIFAAKKYEIPPTNKNEEVHKIESGNHLVYEMVLPQFNDVRVTGGMPSYVSAASGSSIAFTAEDNGLSLVFVIMGSTRTYKENGWSVEYYGNFEESLDLLEYTFSGYKINRLLYNGQILNQFPVTNGVNEVVGGSREELDTVLPSAAKMENLIFRYSVGNLTAPISEGQQIGTVQMWYNNSCVAETELHAMSEVRATGSSGVEIYGATRDDSDLSGVLTFLGILLLAVVIPFSAYLAYNSFRRSMARARRRRRRANRRRSR